TKPRPGHADLIGGMKYNHRDLRNVLERSSARETAARVAVGAVSKILLKQLDIHFYCRVIENGRNKDDLGYYLENIKFYFERNVLKRSSARETAARLALVEFFKILFKQFVILFYSRVMEIGGIKDDLEYDLETIKSNVDKNDVRVINDEIAQQMRDKIDDAKK